MRPEPPRRRTLPARPPGAAALSAGAGFAASLALAAAGGCAIFNESVDVLTPGGYDETAAGDPRLTRFRPVVEQISLEIVSVERPPDDPLLWRALWDPVSEVGAVDADRTAALREAGFRVGVISSEPPEALRTLMGAGETVGAPLPGTERDGVRVQRLPLPAGGDAALHTGPTRPEISVTPPAGDAPDAEPPRAETFEAAGGVVRVRCRTPQPGWATFEFTPEVHYGPLAVRPVPDSTGWTSRTGQKVRSWPDRAFEVTLTVGDSVIVGLREDADPAGLAAALLTAERDGHTAERLLVVRLADVRQLQSDRVER